MEKQGKKRKKRELFSLIGNFITSFITAVIVIVAIFMVAVRLLGWNLFSIDSGSMSPRYPVNTLVVVKDTAPSEIEKGDVVTYVLNEEGVLVTHRVVGIDTLNRTFTTKGDANNSVDASPVLWDNVVGKVIFAVPKLGLPLRVVTAEKNRTILIAVIVILLVVSFFWEIVGRIKNQKSKKKSVGKEEDENERKQKTDAG